MALCLQNTHLRAHQATANLPNQLKNLLHLVAPKNAAHQHEQANDLSRAMTDPGHNAANALQVSAQAVMFIVESHQAKVRANLAQSVQAVSAQNDQTNLVENDPAHLVENVPVDFATIEITTLVAIVHPEAIAENEQNDQNAPTTHVANGQVVDFATNDQVQALLVENAVNAQAVSGASDPADHADHLVADQAQADDPAEVFVGTKVQLADAPTEADLQEVSVVLLAAVHLAAAADAVAADQAAVEAVTAPR